MFRNDKQRRAMFANMNSFSSKSTSKYPGIKFSEDSVFSDDSRNKQLRNYHAGLEREKIKKLREEGDERFVSDVPPEEPVEDKDGFLTYPITDASTQSGGQFFKPEVLYAEVIGALSDKNSKDVDYITTVLKNLTPQQKYAMRAVLEGDDSDEAEFINGNMFSKKNVTRGARFEGKIRSKLDNSNCTAAIRSAGSRSLWDIVCITPDKVKLVQAKTSGYLTPKERKDMLSELKRMPDNIQADVEYYKSPKVITNKTIKKVGETDWDKVEERLDYFSEVRGFKNLGANSV